ncbi:DUF222 domain-containing protein [Arthrobacter sp. M4]|nr:HNH endonuclease signature motif containing protein [Arthrobacter sp. M4]MCA4134057.1 DUF222 domain-containing protein [Arthrobacter sp. M4]
MEPFVQRDSSRGSGPGLGGARIPDADGVLASGSGAGLVAPDGLGVGSGAEGTAGSGAGDGVGSGFGAGHLAPLGSGVGFELLGRLLADSVELRGQAVAEAAVFDVFAAADFAGQVEELSRSVEFLQLVAAQAVDRTRREALAAASRLDAPAGWRTGWTEAHGPDNPDGPGNPDGRDDSASPDDSVDADNSDGPDDSGSRAAGPSGDIPGRAAAENSGPGLREVSGDGPGLSGPVSSVSSPGPVSAAVVSAAVRVVADDGFRTAAEFLRVRLRIGIREAKRRLALAGAVLDSRGIAGQLVPARLGELAGAVAAAEVPSASATAVSMALEKVRHVAEPALLARMERALTRTAAESDPDFVHRVAQRWVDAVDQDGAEPGEEELRRRQGWFLRRSYRGLQHIEIFATPEQFETLATVISTATNPRLRANGTGSTGSTGGPGQAAAGKAAAGKAAAGKVAAGNAWAGQEAWSGDTAATAAEDQAAADGSGHASAGPAPAGGASAGFESAGPASAGGASADTAFAGSEFTGQASAGGASAGSESTDHASVGRDSADTASVGSEFTGRASAGGASAAFESAGRATTDTAAAGCESTGHAAGGSASAGSEWTGHAYTGGASAGPESTDHASAGRDSADRASAGSESADHASAGRASAAVESTDRTPADTAAAGWDASDCLEAGRASAGREGQAAGVNSVLPSAIAPHGAVTASANESGAAGRGDGGGPVLDRRTQAQKALDAVVDACALALATGKLPAHGGVRPQVSVTISYPDLYRTLTGTTGNTATKSNTGTRTTGGLGTATNTRTTGGLGTGTLSDTAEGTGAGSGIAAGLGTATDTRTTGGTASGLGAAIGSGTAIGAGAATGLGSGTGTAMFTGPITAATIRKIACNAEIIPVLMGSEGQVLGIGRASRIFPPHIRKAITARDMGCAFPDCIRPAHWCEAHHITYWSRGGKTSTDNGVMLCSHHHKLMHKEQWRIHVKTGIPWFIPPPHIDPHQTPRRNHYFQPLRT